MARKPLTSLIVEPEKSEKSNFTACVDVPKKPYTRRRATSANQINAWSNAEVYAGSFYLDQEEILRNANKGVKAEKLG